MGKQREESEENNLLRNNLLILDNSEIHLRCKHWVKSLSSAKVVQNFKAVVCSQMLPQVTQEDLHSWRCCCGFFQLSSLGYPVVPQMQTVRTLSYRCCRAKLCRMLEIPEMPSSEEGESKMDGKWECKTGKNTKFFLPCFTFLTTAQTGAFLGRSSQSIGFSSPSLPPSRTVAVKNCPKV